MSTNGQILNEIKLAVLAVDAGAEVILFGSRARGDYKEESDWDMLVLTDETVDMTFKRNIIKKVLPIEIEHSLGVSTVIRNRKEWEEKFSITLLFREIQKRRYFPMSVTNEIIEYRIERSDAAFKMALIAADQQDWNHVCNRLYYSVFTWFRLT